MNGPEMASRFTTWEEAIVWLRSSPAMGALVHDAYYDDPLLAAAQRYSDSAEWQAVRVHLPSTAGATALDVGAGRGIASYALAREGLCVTALEPDGSALVGAEAIRALARDSGLPIAVTQEFSERLPFASTSFDVVFARAVLHHTSDLAAACREFLRVLKPGGRLIAIREHVISRREDLPAFLDAHPLHKLYGGENAFLLDEYLGALDNAGFEVQQILRPLRSAINLAPQTNASVQREIARRISRGLPGAERAIAALLRPLWPTVLPLLERVDNRPGRLYSFIARRP